MKHRKKDSSEIYHNFAIAVGLYTFAGKVEQADFLSEGMFVESGKILFSLIPGEQSLYGQLYLPAYGAGKVKKGNRVKIKLQDYPYEEYGSIEGIVASISIVASEFQSNPQVGKVYLIKVDLPNGLKSNFGQELPFRHNMLGEANIIIQERRLIERLFDNLRYKIR